MKKPGVGAAVSSASMEERGLALVRRRDGAGGSIIGSAAMPYVFLFVCVMLLVTLGVLYYMCRDDYRRAQFKKRGVGGYRAVPDAES